MNNRAVNYLNHGKWDKATDLLEQSITLSPSYEIARQNLSIAFHGQAIEAQKKNDWHKALQYTEKAKFYSLDDNAEQNEVVILSRLGYNPHSILDRITLANHAIFRGDIEGFIVEFKEAYRQRRAIQKIAHNQVSSESEKADSLERNNRAIKALSDNDTDLAIRLFSLLHADDPHDLSSTENLSIALSKKGTELYRKGENKNAYQYFERVLKLTPDDDYARKHLSLISRIFLKTGSEEDQKTFYSEYMDEVTRKIKRAWFPLKSAESDEVVLDFEVNTDGTVTNVKTLKSENVAQVIQAKRALANASPFNPLPHKNSIRFTFKYNVHARRRTPVPISSETPSKSLDPVALGKLKLIADRLQAELAEKQMNSGNANEMLDLRVELIRTYLQMESIEIATYLLDDSKATYPQNQRLISLENEIKKLKTKK